MPRPTRLSLSWHLDQLRTGDPGEGLIIDEAIADLWEEDHGVTVETRWRYWRDWLDLYREDPRPLVVEQIIRGHLGPI